MDPVNEVLKHVKFPFKFHDYQVEDINNACLTDCYGLYQEPGLGKTSIATAVGVYKLLNGFESVMVIVPASLISQWVEFLESLDLATVDYRGSPRKREKINLDINPDFIVCSMQIYQRDFDRLSNLQGLYYIVDESTSLCNTQNVLYKMLVGGVRSFKEFKVLGNGIRMPITRKVRYEKIMHECCLLTGTPINSPLNAYGLISITSPDKYTNYFAFCRHHVLKEDDFGNPITYKNLDEIYEALTENGVIREVGDHLDLPEKIYKIIKYDLSPAHMKLYKKLVDEQLLVLEDGSILDATDANKMYHLCQQFIFNPIEFKGKIEGLEVLDTVVADTKRRIIFSNYVGTNDLIMGRYDAGGCYGAVPRKRQEKYVAAFKAGELDTMAANPKSGGVGLNLQICNQVIAAELCITPRDFKQMEMRCWRQGQNETVVITILVARKTIQETLLKRVLAKGDTAAKVLHSKTSMRKDLMGGN